MFPIDPTIWASVVTATHLVSLEAGKGAASKVGQLAAEKAAELVWPRIQKLLGWTKPPTTRSQVEQDLAGRAKENPDVVRQLLEILQSEQSRSTPWSQLVGQINAEKVVVIGTNSGPITF